METMIPIDIAAQRTGLDNAAIRSLINRKAIKGLKNLNGYILIQLSDLDRLESLSDVPQLEGQPIHQSEAARKYHLEQPSISNWRRSGLIRTIGRDRNRILVDESDVAYIYQSSD